MAGFDFAFQHQQPVRSSSYNRFLHPIPESSEELDFGLQHFRPASPESDLDVREVISNADELELDVDEISEQFPRPVVSIFSTLSDFQFPPTNQKSSKIPFNFEFATDEVAPDENPILGSLKKTGEVLPIELCGRGLHEESKHNRLDTCSPQPGEATYDSLLDFQLSELRHSYDKKIFGTESSQSRPDSPTCGVELIFQAACAQDNPHRESTTREHNLCAPFTTSRTSSVFSKDSETLCGTLGSLRIPQTDAFDDLDWQSGKSPTRSTFQVFPAQEGSLEYAREGAQIPEPLANGYINDGARQTWPLKLRQQNPDHERISCRESGCTLHSFYQEYFNDSTSTHRMSTDTIQALKSEPDVIVASTEDTTGQTPPNSRISRDKLSNIQKMDERVGTLRPELKNYLAVPPPTPPPPDGGAIAWIQVGAASVLFFNTWGLINAFGAFQSYYHATLLANEASNASIAWIGTLTSFLLCASPLAWGPVFDRVKSDSMLRAVVTTATAVVVTGLVATSICTDYWQLVLAQGLCCGIGGGMLFLTAVAVLPEWFTRRRPFAIGLAGAGGSVGGILYPLIFEGVQIRLGFGWSVRVIGLVVLATQMIPCAVIRRRPRTAHLGRQADVESSSAVGADIVDISTNAANFHQICDEVTAHFKALLSDRPFTIFNFGTFFGFAGQYIPFFFLDQYADFSTPIANDAGMDPTSPTILLSSTPTMPPLLTLLLFLNLGGLPGRIIPSLLASIYPEYLPPLHLLALTSATGASLAFLWPALPPDNLSLLVLWSLCYGFCSGAFVSLQGAAVAQMAATTAKTGSEVSQTGAERSEHPQRPSPGLGTRFGVNMCAAAFGMLIGAPAAGALLALPSGGWLSLQMYCGTVLALSTIAVVAAGSYAVRYQYVGGTDRGPSHITEAPRQRREATVTVKSPKVAKATEVRPSGAQPLRGTRPVNHKRRRLSIWPRGLRNLREEAERKRNMEHKETYAEQEAKEARQREHSMLEFLQGPK